MTANTGTATPGRIDLGILLVTATLAVAGIIIMYSSSFVFALVRYGDPNYFLFRQLIWAALGVVLMVAAVRVDYRRLRSLAVPAMGLTIAVLIVVLVIGVEANGARRWIGVGPYAIQPSEFAKLSVIVYLAAWLEGKRTTLTTFEHGLLPFVMILGSIAFLIMLQPNMGTTLIIVAITLTMFWVAGASVMQMIGLLSTGAVTFLALALVSDYRSDRLATFFGGNDDPLGHGFQTLQSLIAIGNGGVAGLGLGASRSKFFYIPESHTDGVFAILAEEAGLIAAATVILLFMLFMIRGFQLARQAPDGFGRLIATGVTTWITVQALMNMGGIMRVIPLTGVPLPFLSYGGNALAAELLAVGVLLSISKARGTAAPRTASSTPARRQAPAAPQYTRKAPPPQRAVGRARR